MRILGMVFVLILFVLDPGHAATINLTNGSSIQGDVVKRDNKSIQVNVDGVTMTYYADEIKDVDGTPFASAGPEPAPTATVPAPTQAPAQAEAASVPVSSPAAEAASNAETLTTGGGAIDPDKRALILKFIDVFGTRQALINNFAAMLKQIEKDKPDEAQKIQDRVKVDEIIERLLPIYDRNFSADDLKTFIDFYGSAKGQKLISTIPELMKESVQESVKYMEEKFPEVKQ